MGQGHLGIRLDRKIRNVKSVNEPRNSRDLAVQSIPSRRSRVRLIAQLEKKKSMRDHGTSLDSVQIAVSCRDPDILLLAGHFG